MTITQLSTFMKISETRNFTSAAGSLGYAQSTVTTHIKQLEDELGCLLFERLGKTVVLTPEGERLVQYADKLLRLEREIHLEVPEASEPSGVLKLGISESLCYDRFPRILVEYRKKHPMVEIRLQFITHDVFPELLKKGALDLVYTLNPYIEDRGLAMLYRQREYLGFYCAPGFPLAGKNLTEQDLEGVPLLLTSHNCSFRRMLLSDLEQAKVTPRIIMETSSKEILKQFAANGLGVAFMPDMAAENDVKAGKLIKLAWSGSDFPVFSQVFVHKEKRVGRAIGGLVEMIM